MVRSPGRGRSSSACAHVPNFRDDRISYREVAYSRTSLGQISWVECFQNEGRMAKPELISFNYKNRNVSVKDQMTRDGTKRGIASKHHASRLIHLEMISPDINDYSENQLN